MDNSHLHNKKELFTLISEGDEAAFTSLVDQYWKRLLSQAIVYVKDAFKAQDIVQEVFLTIWNSRAGLAAIEKPENYLFIITKNKILSEFRKKLELPVHDSLENISIDAGVEERVSHKRLQQLILQAVEQMSAQRKRVFELSRDEGLTYDQIATQMNISRETVKGHMVKALAFVRAFLGIHWDLTPAIIGLIIFFEQTDPVLILMRL